MLTMRIDNYTRITLRIPEELHSKLVAEAARTSKSMNAEIVNRLEASFASPPQGANILAEMLLYRLAIAEFKRSLERAKTQDPVDADEVANLKANIAGMQALLRGVLSRLDEAKLHPFTIDWGSAVFSTEDEP